VADDIVGVLTDVAAWGPGGFEKRAIYGRFPQLAADQNRKD